MGNKDDESSIPSKKRKEETWSNYFTRTCRIAKKIWVNIVTLIVRNARRQYVETYGLGL